MCCDVYGSRRKGHGHRVRSSVNFAERFLQLTVELLGRGREVRVGIHTSSLNIRMTLNDNSDLNSKKNRLLGTESGY